jgi:hypothetical protein
MSSPLLGTNGQTFQGLFPADTIQKLIPESTPEANLWNHSDYPTIQDMVEYALGDAAKWEELVAVWRGVSGSDRLFISAIQVYYAGILCNHHGGNIHPLPMEFSNLVDMGTVDNRDLPSAIL